MNIKTNKSNTCYKLHHAFYMVRGRLIYMWPNSKLGTMGSEQAGIVLTMAANDNRKTQGKPVNINPDS